MSERKRKFKFTFEAQLPTGVCAGTGECFGRTLGEAMAAAAAGVKKDVGPSAVVTSVREVLR